MLNKIILIGRLTKEPESYKKEDSNLVSFDLAVDNAGKDAGTTFITCKCFQKTADNVENYLHKGAKVAVEGRLLQRNYMAKDGSKRSTYEVVCDRVAFLDPKEQAPVVSTEDITDEPVLAEDSKESPKYDPFTGKPLKPQKSK